MGEQWDHGGRRMLLVDNTGVGAVMLRSIRLQCIGFWISIGFAYLYIHMPLNIWKLHLDFRKTKLGPVLPEGRYCISSVVSLLTPLIGPYSKLEILLKCLPIFCIVKILQKDKWFVPQAKSTNQLSEPTNLPIKWVPGLLRRKVLETDGWTNVLSQHGTSSSIDTNIPLHFIINISFRV
jgi:hypothetical protein